LQNDLAFFRICILHVRVEETTYLLVIVLQTLENEELWDDKEDLRVSLLKLVRKLPVLLTRRFNHLTEVQQLVESLAV